MVDRIRLQDRSRTTPEPVIGFGRLDFDIEQQHRRVWNEIEAFEQQRAIVAHMGRLHDGRKHRKSGSWVTIGSTLDAGATDRRRGRQRRPTHKHISDGLPTDIVERLKTCYSNVELEYIVKVSSQQDVRSKVLTDLNDGFGMNSATGAEQ